MAYVSSAIWGLVVAFMVTACADKGANGSGDTVAPAPVVKKIKPGEITGVDIERLFSLTESNSVLLVDCRPGLFYRLGHIEGALSMPLKKYQDALNTNKKLFDRALAEGKIIVFYCQNLNCPDAYLFAKAIAREGYSTSVYKGGWEEWKASGL